MTSKRQTIINQIKSAIEADSTVYGSTDSKINKVLTEPTKVVMQQNSLTVVPVGRRTLKEYHGKKKRFEWTFTLKVLFKQLKRESNDGLYQVVENLGKLFYHHTLGGNADYSDIDSDKSLINQSNQTIMDGFDLVLTVETIEAMS